MCNNASLVIIYLYFMLSKTKAAMFGTSVYFLAASRGQQSELSLFHLQLESFQSSTLHLLSENQKETLLSVSFQTNILMLIGGL